MIESANELKQYIEKNLEENFEKIASAKNSEHNNVLFYKHKQTGKMLVERISQNRNDDVFRALKGKKIPNFATVYEVCSDDESLIVLEEFIDGKNLLDVLNGKSLPVKTACRYASDICTALDEIHKLGIVHRDIKPSNVIIDDNSKATLIDLSIARLISSFDDKDTNSLGTIGFAAPEQFGISQSGIATDIYSLGVLLNIMITGVHPAIDVPSGPVKYVINKAVSTHMAKRYKSAAQFQHDLRFFI